MRIIFIALASIAILLGLLFVILPMGNIAIIPSIVGVLFAGLAYIKSDGVQKKFPKVLLIIMSVLLVIGASKQFFVKTELAKDDSFEERVEDSQKKAIEELDGLE